jgi:hypothetical protein
MAFRHYVETLISWQNPSLDTDNQWLEYDVGICGIPPSAVAEIVIGNTNGFDEYLGGVRSTSSSLNRYVDIVKSEHENATITMHVQVDASGKIEYFSEHATSINFNLVGYWVGCEYTELIEEFDPAVSNSWQDKTLSGYGVGSGEVTEIALCNHAQNIARNMSVREVGLSRTKLFNISDAEGAGNNCLSTLVKASGASATIQVYTEGKFATRMYALGYFTTPPGDFVEVTEDFGAPPEEDESTWVDLDVGSSGVASGSNAHFQISLGHAFGTLAGVRATTSTLDRYLQIDYPLDAVGRAYMSMAVNVDSSGYIQRFANNLLTPNNPSFECLGYWTNFTDSTEPFPINNFATLYIEGLNINIHYIENYTGNDLSPATMGSWQPVDASSENYSWNAVAEIFSRNLRHTEGLYDGVRASGSTLERKIYLRDSWPSVTAGDNLTWHVQLQDNSQFEMFGSGSISSLFNAYSLGYWIGSEYVELYETFKATAQSGWVNHNLASYGVPSGKIAQIVIANADENMPQSGGVRQVGSTIDRVIEMNGLVSDAGPTPGSYDVLPMFVNTSGSDSTIQVYAGNSGLMDFMVVGYWSIAPGTFTERLTPLTVPAASGSWESIDLEIIGYPFNSTASICLGNTSYAEANFLGVREAETTCETQEESESRTNPDRRIKVRETNFAGSGTWGADVYTAHVNLGDCGLAEFYHSLPSGDTRFWGLGYWSDFRLQKTRITKSATLFIRGPTPIQVLTSGDLYIEGHKTITASGDLFIQGNDESTISTDLFIIGGNTITDNRSLYIHGQDEIDESKTLIITGLEHSAASGDLFIAGLSPAIITSGIADLYIQGQEPVNSSSDLYIQGKEETNGSSTLFIAGQQSTSTSGDLYIRGHNEATQSSTLFLGGQDSTSTSGDLFVHGFAPYVASSTLFILGSSPDTASSTLYIGGYVQVSGSASLVIVGHSIESASKTLYISGPESISGSSTLFVRGSGIIPVSSTAVLFINGSEPKPSTVCPALDPTAVIQIPASLIRTYQGIIDGMVNQLGKNVVLEFDPTLERCPNCEFDTLRKRSLGIYIPGGPRPFVRGRKCPYCKGKGLLETSTTQCIKCLTEWNPQDARKYGISVEKASDTVKLKTYIWDADSLIIAKTAIVDHDIIEQMKLRVRLIKGPIPLGLREDRYCVSFWELI